MNMYKLLKAALAVLFFLCAPLASAQDRSPITILVGFAPGGTSDLTARLIAQYLPEHIGRPVVVVNRPGALGVSSIRELISTDDVNRVYVVLPFSSVIFPALTRTPAPYDVFNDMQPVASIASFTLGVAVNAGTGVKTPRDLVAWMKANPKSTIFGTAGAGGHNHFLGLDLGKAIGVDSTVVPYKGNAPMMSDLLPGHIPAAVMVAGEVISHTEGGRVRLVGVLTPTRSTLMPDVPTFAEQGVNVTSGESWYGMWAPAKAEKTQVQKMQDAVRKILANKEVQRTLAEKLAMQADFRDSSQTDQRLRRDHAYWAPIIKASGFKAD